MKLTEHFSLEEFCSSSTARSLGIHNVPTEAEIENMRYLCEKVLEPLRLWWGKSILLGSGFRCEALNKAVGGVSNSQHRSGQAVDLFLQGNIETGRKWFEYIRKYLPFDQLILEHNKKGTYWVHVSLKKSGNRKQVIWNLLKK